MITVIRTATAFPGMTGEALAWAKEIATVVKRVPERNKLFARLLPACSLISHGLDIMMVWDNTMSCALKSFRITTMA